MVLQMVRGDSLSMQETDSRRSGEIENYSHRKEKFSIPPTWRTFFQRHRRVSFVLAWIASFMTFIVLVRPREEVLINSKKNPNFVTKQIRYRQMLGLPNSNYTKRMYLSIEEMGGQYCRLRMIQIFHVLYTDHRV